MLKRSLIPVILFLSVLLLPPANSANNSVMVLTVDGVINPVSAEFMEKGIARANEMSLEAILVQLDTPGGLDTSMRKIIKAINASNIPVIVYVSPSGARAASAGVFITMAAHVAAMSPGTNIGAAHPVGMGGKIRNGRKMP
jgi:membrane-bound serine protease (ClpP class)